MDKLRYEREREFVETTVKNIFHDKISPDEFSYLEITLMKTGEVIRGIDYNGRLSTQLVDMVTENDKYHIYSVRGNDDDGYPTMIECYPVTVNHVTDIILTKSINISKRGEYLELEKDIRSNIW